MTIRIGSSTRSHCRSRLAGIITASVTCLRRSSRPLFRAARRRSIGRRPDSAVPGHGEQIAAVACSHAESIASTGRPDLHAATVFAYVGTYAVLMLASASGGAQGIGDPAHPLDGGQSERLMVARAADLSLANTVNDATPAIGSQVSFQITVANDGPGAAQRVVVRDRLPAGYAYVSHSATRGTYNRDTGQWSGFAVAQHGSVTLTIVATALRDGNHMNVAEIVASSAPDPDSTPGNGNVAEDDYAMAGTSPRAPNIIVLMLDDLDTRSLEDLLNAQLMPSLQGQVIDRGVQFSEAYVTTPLCCHRALRS